ncbi:hypothetical protein IWX87_001121 [Polaromonas sp. CG_9.7]|uniref:hypothetical protein n=1 Tax=Polaromonas sp. CG_23.6 TaxID=2760709 RepID=UPI001A2934D2|nr:hypothetical protein [Polaromonas sp. CG_23.6]MBG6071368.1 hypothetical protein [Polaromonas sp. CG_9.7]MBG6113368.1 hypothetical protein [Polaromonas sp. CG_9.2]MDH6183174.1 hypothetical protein [Polaromonas sp. CG_23.6]
MENLQATASPSPFTCPDCGGLLFETDDRRQVRYRCHTGHAFSRRSLADQQETMSDAALWTRLRGLQKKKPYCGGWHRASTLSARKAHQTHGPRPMRLPTCAARLAS